MNRYKGFTLVEILLALAILGIGLVSILSVFAVGTNSVRRTVAMTEASFIGQMVIEDFKRQAYSNPSSYSVPEDDIVRYYHGYRVDPPNPKSVGGVPNLYSVDVKVYKDNSQTPLVQFTTYLTKYEP